MKKSYRNLTYDEGGVKNRKRHGKSVKKRIEQVAEEKSSETVEDDGDNSPSGLEKSGKEFEIPDQIDSSLNLSKLKIREFPEALLDKMQHIQYLYLEGNKLMALPEKFFEALPSLKWLDLRNNRLLNLPTVGLGKHLCLEVVLLQGNRIRNLPIEFAKIPSLKGLQTTGNPITNVPYDAVAGGFHGVIRHLSKLCSQNEILVPDSDAILVKPSTSKDESEMEVSTEPSDSELRKWDLEKLSQWRKFIKKSAGSARPEEMLFATKTNEKTSEPKNKISISVHSQLVPQTKIQPFRCGLYNRNRHKIVSSALHYRKLKKTRLGYKKKPLTVAMLQEKARKEVLRNQMRETLEKQARKIQRMRDKEVLKSWRDHARFTRQQMKLLDNYQMYPSRDFASKTPFDVDPEFLNMLNRVDLYRSLKEYDSRSKRIIRPKSKITALDLERQMNEIMKKLQDLDTNVDEEMKSPRTKQTHMCNKMSKILDIQKTLKNLQNLNSSMSGILPLIKPKEKK